MVSENLKLEMRISAIEHLLCDLWVKYYLRIGATHDQIMSAQAAVLERLKSETFPGLDAASSDLAASELEEAVCGLLAMQQEMMEPMKHLLGRQ